MKLSEALTIVLREAAQKGKVEIVGPLLAVEKLLETIKEVENEGRSFDEAEGAEREETSGS